MTLLRKLIALALAAAKPVRVACVYFAVTALIPTRPVMAKDAPPLPWGPTPSAEAAYARANAIAALGQSLFFDPALSASGRMACATCHDPAHGFSAPDAAAVRMGGKDLNRPGTRAVPSLMYGALTPSFSEHYFESEDEGNESVDQGPAGGRSWDGRVDRARDQALLPILDSNEMANPGPGNILAAIKRAPYVDDVKRLYGSDVLDDPARMLKAVTEALEFYQETPATFTPYSSKYDAFLAGEIKLTEPQARGLAIFNDPAKGNCASCHKSAVTADGKPPLFTDFGFVALGLPRNQTIPANADPGYFDLGLCGPQRHDLATVARYCGMFKAPTLRNVATKQNFYHNGIFHTLRDAVAFYAERDINPSKWYPAAPDGTVRKFDDLPTIYLQNVTSEPPFGPERLLSDADVDDIVAFLQTLTDGYQP